MIATETIYVAKVPVGRMRWNTETGQYFFQPLHVDDRRFPSVQVKTFDDPAALREAVQAACEIRDG